METGGGQDEDGQKELFDDIQFDPHLIEALERDYQETIAEIQSNRQFDNFRKELDKVHYSLTHLTESVNRWIGRCKSFHTDISRNAKIGQEHHAQLRDADQQLLQLTEVFALEYFFLFPAYFLVFPPTTAGARPDGRPGERDEGETAQ